MSHLAKVNDLFEDYNMYCILCCPAEQTGFQGILIRQLTNCKLLWRPPLWHTCSVPLITCTSVQ